MIPWFIALEIALVESKVELNVKMIGTTLEMTKLSGITLSGK
jgi:hypothetical protein